MSLVPSLLQAIVSLDGEACVIHVGDKPYVVAPSGQVDLATRGLTFEAVNGILEQLLPVETLNALDEFGAIQYELPARPEFRHERFTVVAARGGEDVWVEIRRKRAPDEDRVPIETFATPEPIAAHDPESMRQDPGDDLSMPDSADLWPDDGGGAGRGAALRRDGAGAGAGAGIGGRGDPSSCVDRNRSAAAAVAVRRAAVRAGDAGSCDEQGADRAGCAACGAAAAVDYAPPPVQYAPPPVQYTPPPVQHAAAARRRRTRRRRCTRRPCSSAPNRRSPRWSCRCRATRFAATRRRS